MNDMIYDSKISKTGRRPHIEQNPPNIGISNSESFRYWVIAGETADYFPVNINFCSAEGLMFLWS